MRSNKHPGIFEIRSHNNLSRDQKLRLELAEQRSRNQLESLESLESLQIGLHNASNALKELSTMISSLSKEISTGKKIGMTEPGNDETDSLESSSTSSYN